MTHVRNAVGAAIILVVLVGLGFVAAGKIGLKGWQVRPPIIWPL
jgi:hypothetical protein